MGERGEGKGREGRERRGIQGVRDGAGRKFKEIEETKKETLI